MKRKEFRPGERVEAKLSPGSPIWTPASYLGVFTIHYGHRPWHLVQVNANKHQVPANRIRRSSP